MSALPRLDGRFRGALYVGLGSFYGRERGQRFCRKRSLTSIVYPRLALLVTDDFLEGFRDRVVVDFRFGGRVGSGEDVSASEAFSAVANAASPVTRSFQASS